MLNRIKIPDIATILNALCGLTAIFLSLYEYTPLIPILILFAAILDGIDGYLARKFTASNLGTTLDSMADVISFGIAPVVLLFLVYEFNILLILSLYLFVSCCILRLARFESDTKKTNVFEGLPTTYCGVMIASFVLTDFHHAYANIASFFTILFAMLMISSISFPKVRNIKIIVPIFIIFGFTIVGNILNIYASFFSFMLFILMCFYLIYPFSDWIKKKIEY